MVGYATAFMDDWPVSPNPEPTIRDYWRELAKQSVRPSSYDPNDENAEEYAEIIVLADTPIDRLRQRYEFRNHAAVKDYLADNPSLPSVLEKARDKIHKYFGPDARAVLDVIKDGEMDSRERLFVFIPTELSADEALDRLDELYEQWWLEALSKVSPKLSIDVEFV